VKFLAAQAQPKSLDAITEIISHILIPPNANPKHNRNTFQMTLKLLYESSSILISLLTGTPQVTQDLTYANSILHKFFHKAQNKIFEM
jgi:hypothetical protein